MWTPRIRAGVATHGPCYELQHSVWDACLWIGLPVLSKWDSVMATLLLLLNIFAQVGFVLVVQIDMLEDVLTSEKLDELLLFRELWSHSRRALYKLCVDVCIPNLEFLNNSTCLGDRGGKP